MSLYVGNIRCNKLYNTCIQSFLKPSRQRIAWFGKLLGLGANNMSWVRISFANHACNDLLKTAKLRKVGKPLGMEGISCY